MVENNNLSPREMEEESAELEVQGEVQAEEAEVVQAGEIGDVLEKPKASENGAEWEEEENMDMNMLYEETLKHIQEGEILSGTILSIGKDSVLVDVGYKSEGSIPLYEFSDHGKDLQVGETIEVYLEKREDSEGVIVLSREKAGKIKIWDEINRAYEGNESIEGTVLARIKGGLSVDIGLKAFLPGSQVDIRPVRNLDKLIGQKLKMKVIKLNRKRGNIVLSRRAILEEEREDSKKEILSSLAEGQILEGVVKNITDYGAFIDLGGIDGLLHITDMSWGRVRHPSDLYSVGDKVQVKVIKYDREHERVSLGAKQVTPDPWDDVDVKYLVSTTVGGKVVSISDYGAFIELEEGVEGLVHVSEISWDKRLKHPSKVVSIADNVEVMVLNVDKGNKRISLGMKQLQPNPWSTIKEKYPEGSVVEGKVRNITDFGAFVALEDGIDGLIHISDISWAKRVRHPSEILKKGQRVSAMVLNVDQGGERLSLGLKQLQVDPWEKVGEKYNVEDVVETRIVKLANFGAFAEIEEGIEGLIHLSQLSKKKINQPSEVVSLDDKVLAKIIKIDLEGKKIGLSLKACEGEMERAVSQTVPEEMEEVTEEPGQTIQGTEDAPLVNEAGLSISENQGNLPELEEEESSDEDSSEYPSKEDSRISNHDEG